jgi:hypothetical protein
VIDHLWSYWGKHRCHGLLLRNRCAFLLGSNNPVFDRLDRVEEGGILAEIELLLVNESIGNVPLYLEVLSLMPFKSMRE